MRKFAKTAAALAFAAVMTAALTGCGGNNNSTAQSGAGNNSAGQTPNSVKSENDNSTNGDLSTELDSQIIKSKVTSADAAAKSLRESVMVWVYDNASYGGEYPSEGEVTIVCDKGKVTTTGVITDADKVEKNPKTLSQMLTEEYSTSTFRVKVYMSAGGQVSGVVYVDGETSADETELPDKDAFKAGSWKWDGKKAGVTPSGKIVGTSPQVQLAVP